MKPSLIFWPVIAQVALTLAIALRMYAARVHEIKARRIRLQALATSRGIADTLQDTGAADNFRNLFELPVLFYAICPILFVTDHVTTLQLALAWIFVVLRCAHSYIHVTYNRVMHRFQIYALGMLCVFAMWVVFAVQLLRG